MSRPRAPPRAHAPFFLPPAAAPPPKKNLLFRPGRSASGCLPRRQAPGTHGLTRRDAASARRREAKNSGKRPKDQEARQVEKVSSALFFKYNEALGPPYRVLIDTNFINFSIKNKIDLVQGMVDCLYAKCVPCICDAVMAELEKLGEKYRVALKLAKDKRLERIPNPPGTSNQTYADDVLVEIVKQHRCYIVATCDRDLKRRIRKIPGVPIMYIHNHRYSIERLPEATMGGAPRI